MRTLAPTAFLVSLVGCSTKVEPTGRDTKETDRLQGVWAVESVESGAELSVDERKWLTDARLHIQGDRFTLGGGDDWAFSTFVADWVREPKALILYEADAEGKPPPSGKGIPKPARTRTWLYKFDSDKLVLAFVRVKDAESVPAPADFKAEAGQNVVVLRLTKTNEEPRTQWDVKPKPAGQKK